jgi:hypothetical protein
MTTGTVLPPRGRRLAIGYGNSLVTTADSPSTQLRAQLSKIRFGSFPLEEDESNSSRFLSLPRELRNAIYHALWTLTPLRSIFYHGSLVKLHYNSTQLTSSTPCISGLPTWLLTNKATYLEAQAQLHLHATWTFEPALPRPDPKWTLIRPFRRCPSESSFHTDAPRQDTTLVHLSCVRDLTFRTHKPACHKNKVFDIPVQDRALIRSVLQSRFARLRVVRLAAEFSWPEKIVGAGAWRLDLGWFERAAGLGVKSFEYEIRGLDMLCEQGLRGGAVWRQMQAAFAVEMERVGRIVVGGEGKLEVRLLSKRVLKFGVWQRALECKFVFAKKS